MIAVKSDTGLARRTPLVIFFATATEGVENLLNQFRKMRFPQFLTLQRQAIPQNRGFVPLLHLFDFSLCPFRCFHPTIPAFIAYHPLDDAQNANENSSTVTNVRHSNENHHTGFHSRQRSTVSASRSTARRTCLNSVLTSYRPAKIITSSATITKSATSTMLGV